jgi:hypothetical protein
MAYCTKSQTWIGNQVASHMLTWGHSMVVPDGSQLGESTFGVTQEAMASTLLTSR